MPVNFVRSLGEESDVQLNPLVDGSDIPIQGAGDQNFAIPMRNLRGRVDKPFTVSSHNFYRKMGYGEAMRVTELNEAWVHVFEALNNGAKNAIVKRLVSDDYVNNWLSLNLSQLAEQKEETLTAKFSDLEQAKIVAIGDAFSLVANAKGGSGQYVYHWWKDNNSQKGSHEPSFNFEALSKNDVGVFQVGIDDENNVDLERAFSTCSIAVYDDEHLIITNIGETQRSRAFTKRTTGDEVNPIAVTLEQVLSQQFEISIKHHECFNDGISLSFHADEERNEVSELAPATKIRVRIFDSRKNKIFEFSGSLDPDAKDDYGASNYLPDVVELATEDLELKLNLGLAEIPVNSQIYGFDAYGQEKWVTTDVVQYFDEGTVGAYTTENYYNACVALEKTEYQYKYLASGGNKNTALIGQLADLAYRTNRQFRFDTFVANNGTPYTVEEMIRMLKGMYGDFDPTFAHLIHGYWTPLKCNDPTGVNGRVILGSATLNIALACKRNGMKNAQGFAPKNYPVAGKSFPINRTGVTQIYTPSQPELSQLAQAKINPVVYESYEDGGRYVFKDSLTFAPVTNSLRKLIAVAEMSTSVDDAVTSTGKAYLQFPMEVAVKNMKDWLQVYLEGAQTALWLVPSKDPQMGGASFKFEVTPNELRPYDQMDVKYWVRYDGTNRQTFVTQTLTK